MSLRHIAAWSIFATPVVALVSVLVLTNTWLQVLWCLGQFLLALGCIGIGVGIVVAFVWAWDVLTGKE